MLDVWKRLQRQVSIQLIAPASGATGFNYSSELNSKFPYVSIQLIAPASGAMTMFEGLKTIAEVSIQLIAPASGASVEPVLKVANAFAFPFN